MTFPNSDHVMLSRKFTFCLFINYAYIIFMYVNAHAIGQHLKETVLWSTIIWFEKGKQNIQEEG